MLLNRYCLEDWLSCTKARAFPVIGMGTFVSGAKTYYGAIAKEYGAAVHHDGPTNGTGPVNTM
jgi:hypothetical protein